MRSGGCIEVALQMITPIHQSAAPLSAKQLPRFLVQQPIELKDYKIHIGSVAQN
jgi:hypothetical protein